MASLLRLKAAEDRALCGFPAPEAIGKQGEFQAKAFT